MNKKTRKAVFKDGQYTVYEKIPVYNWIPMQEVLNVLNHPNFYWGSLVGFTDMKYTTLRIDTRDNCCLVMDRHGNQIDFNKLKEALENPIMPSMNENTKLEMK